jgi:hypothetical protein
MTSKNVKTLQLQITWIQWVTLIAAIATLFLVAAPRFRQHPVPAVHEATEDNRRPERPEGKRGPQRQRGTHEQQPEMVAP